MSTRSTRRGNVITAEEDLPQFKQPKKSTKGNKNKDVEENKNSNIPIKKSKNVLMEQDENKDGGGLPEKRRATRSVKVTEEVEAVDEIIETKTKGKKNKQKEIAIIDPVLESEESSKENLVERKSKRGKKNTNDVLSHIAVADLKKEQKQKKSKKILKEVDNDENDKSVGEIVVVAPSKRGSTEKCLNTKPAKRTRRAVKAEAFGESTPTETIKVNQKKSIEEKVPNESCNSNKTDDTSYHSVQQSPPEIITRDSAEKQSLNDTFIVESEDSKKSDSSDILNVTYELLDSTKTEEDKARDAPNSIQKLVESIESKTRSRRTLRMSGIEEIAPIGNTTLNRDGTFIKDSETETSINVSKNKFSAASPCRIFSNSKLSNGFDKLKSYMFKTPPKAFCSAISFGSAGRTPMPPTKPSTPEKCDEADKKSIGRRKSVVMNLARSLEKAEKAKETVVESTVGKNRGKVTFCSPQRQVATGIPVASKIVKSSMKGSDKSFTSTTNSGHKAGLRKRSLTQPDAEQRSQKIMKLSHRSLNTSMSRLNKHKTPVSDAKQGVLRPLGKMPDFSSIHKKQFDQMESLVQNKARREARAKLFTNTTTPANAANKTLNTTVTAEPPKAKDPSTRTPCFTRFGFKLKTSPSKEAPKWTAPQFKFKATPGKDIKEALKWTAPQLKAKTPTKETKEVPKWSAAQFKPKTPSKETKEVPKWSAAQFKPRTTKAQARNAILRVEDNVVEKKRASNRDYVKGVRSNRRFELQMKSRNIII